MLFLFNGMGFSGAEAFWFEILNMVILCYLDVRFECMLQSVFPTDLKILILRPIVKQKALQKHPVV